MTTNAKPIDLNDPATHASFGGPENYGRHVTHVLDRPAARLAEGLPPRLHHRTDNVRARSNRVGTLPSEPRLWGIFHPGAGHGISIPLSMREGWESPASGSAAIAAGFGAPGIKRLYKLKANEIPIWGARRVDHGSGDYGFGAPGIEWLGTDSTGQPIADAAISGLRPYVQTVENLRYNGDQLQAAYWVPDGATVTTGPAGDLANQDVLTTTATNGLHGVMQTIAGGWAAAGVASLSAIVSGTAGLSLGVLADGAAAIAFDLLAGTLRAQSTAVTFAQIVNLGNGRYWVAMIYDHPAGDQTAFIGLDGIVTSVGAGGLNPFLGAGESIRCELVWAEPSGVITAPIVTDDNVVTRLPTIPKAGDLVLGADWTALCEFAVPPEGAMTPAQRLLGLSGVNDPALLLIHTDQCVYTRSSTGNGAEGTPLAPGVHRVIARQSGGRHWLFHNGAPHGTDYAANIQGNLGLYVGADDAGTMQGNIPVRGFAFWDSALTDAECSYLSVPGRTIVPEP